MPAYLVSAARGRVHRGPPVSAWPITAGMDAWWDPSHTHSITFNTGNVSAWLDRIAGHALAQASSPAQPAWGANGLTFSGAQFLAGAPGVAAALDQTGPCTVMCKVKFDSAAAQMMAWGSGRIEAVTTQRCHGATTTKVDLLGHGGTNTTGTESVATTDRVLVHSHDGTRVKTWVDGVLSVDTTRGNLSPGIEFDQFTLGSRWYNGSATLYLTGVIGDVVVAFSALSDSDRQAGEAWLASRPAL